ncbi:VanZ family protein [Umezawaea tangerina]|uniref:VanZ like protein n=1 Tax=Umezawaea tangerina TaxID=84725 RepID=A0A2T0THC8_9PSEU|nr:VanZ family protein [Umezawaea tangerina]PRY45097.1 VanZ like protein [Umezawaea tangerina]
MITDFLLDHSDLVPVMAVLVVAVCCALGYLLVRTRRSDAAPVLWILAVLSAIPLVAVTLVPTGIRADDGVLCAVQLFLPTSGSVELLANIALFLPLVLFAALASRRPLLVVLVAVVGSFAIEAVQAVLPVIGRRCDTEDWAMNTVGILVAGVLARIVLVFARSAER